MTLTKLGTPIKKNSGQLSIEFLIILLIIIAIISLFIPILIKVYNYTTISFDLANIKNFTKEINQICYLGEGSIIYTNLNLNNFWNFSADGNNISWSSKNTNKTYSSNTCIDESNNFDPGKYSVKLTKNKTIELIIENSK